MTASKVEFDPSNFIRVLHSVFDPVSKFRVLKGRLLSYGETLAPGVLGTESYSLYHDAGLDTGKLTYTDPDTGLEYPTRSPMLRKVSMTSATYRIEDQCLMISVADYPSPHHGFPDELRNANLAGLLDEAERVLMLFYQGIAILAEDWARKDGLHATCLALSPKQLRLFRQAAAGAAQRADGSAIVYRREV